MWHVLVSTETEGLVEAVRAAEPPDAVVLSARGVDATLELLGRSSRVDAVLTDDPGVERAIREELFGALPVVVLAEERERDPAEAWRLVGVRLGSSGNRTR